MRLRIAILAGVLFGCSSTTESGVVPDIQGDWGGPDANVTLTPTGGSVEYGCGLAVLDKYWRVSPSGIFTATAKHFTEGGPVPPGVAPSHPARITGQVQGDLLTFTLTDLHQTLGPFTVERGKVVQLLKCL
jgi:hypothetical protein